MDMVKMILTMLRNMELKIYDPVEFFWLVDKLPNKKSFKN